MCSTTRAAADKGAARRWQRANSKAARLWLWARAPLSTSSSPCSVSQLAADCAAGRVPSSGSRSSSPIYRPSHSTACIRLSQCSRQPPPCPPCATPLLFWYIRGLFERNLLVLRRHGRSLAPLSPTKRGLSPAPQYDGLILPPFTGCTPSILHRVPAALGVHPPASRNASARSRPGVPTAPACAE